ALCRAAGGTHYDLCSAKPDTVCFQPLAEIESPEGRARAARWLDVAWDVQGRALTPELRGGARDALRLIGRMPPHERPLTQLHSQLQNDRMRSAIGYYTAEFGNYGQLLDSAHDDLRDGSYHVFEVKHLLAFRDDKVS